MDHLRIVDLEIMAHHGVFPEEKKLGQKFLVSVDCAYNMKNATKEEDLTQSVHYGLLCNDITRLLTENTYDLLETCAYRIVQHIFSVFPFVREATVSIKKPFAPIGLPLAYPEVSITRKWRTYWIALGTNMGNRQANLKKAVNTLNASGLTVKKASSVLETKAWGKTDQPDFLNQVVEVQSFEEPEDVLTILQRIEANMGRVRHEHWGPRPIDLDILLVDREIIQTDRLTVPHPYMTERDFVLEPLNEIAPFLLHPVYGKSIREIYSALHPLKEK